MTEQTEGAEVDDRFVYGALARAEALAAGDPGWMNVTRWPRAAAAAAAGGAR